MKCGEWMRTEKEVLDQILNFANEHNLIRAVVLNGSRVNPNVKKDILCDYDVIFYLTDPHVFVRNQDWIKNFGEIIILQQNSIHDPDQNWFIFLMLFVDGVRIDLSYKNIKKAETLFKDSLSKVILDKDMIFNNVESPSDKSYHTQKPNEEEFHSAINNILWCSTNVAKGLWRSEIPYAKYMQDVIVRDDLVKLLSWYVAMNNGWTINTGKAGRWLEKYLPINIWNSFVNTYASNNNEHIWNAIFEMIRITRIIGTELSQHLGFEYPHTDERRVNEYLIKIQSLPKAAKSL
jgi:aminoglycoside 6-adenylyltransferase